MSKKVLILTYYFPPSGGAGVQRWLKFSKYLPESGVEPIVITVDERYASYPQIDETLLSDVPSGLKVYKTRTSEVLSLYKKVTPTGQLPHTGFANEQSPTLKQKISRFIRGNFFLPDPRRGWNRYAYAKACELIEQEGIDTVITTSPPHSTQLIGLKLKRKYPSIRWIADLRDPWSDIYYNKSLYQTALAKACNRRLERQVLETADELITVSNECLRNFQSKTSKPLPIHLIPNGYDEADFIKIGGIEGNEGNEGIEGIEGIEGNSNSSNSSNSYNTFLTISYVGSLAPQYDRQTFNDALDLLPSEIRKQIDVKYINGVSHAAAINYMCTSDILLLLLPNQAENKGIVTGKLFEYMASGRPVLAICFKDGDAANILSKYEQEGVFAFGESQEIADYLTKAVESKRDNPQQPITVTNSKAAQAYSRRTLTKKVAQIILK